MRLLKIRKPRKPVSLVKMVPNIVTLFGLTVGVSSIKFALDGKWELAVLAVLGGGVLDGLDGRIARILNATSPFGKELDSLCDFANFGVAPSVIIYLWSVGSEEFKPISWACMLLFIVCSAVRLARFNITSAESEPLSKNFSIGVPAPAAAMLALTPIILDFEIGPKLDVVFRGHAFFINIYIACVSFLMAGRVPTFILKNLTIKPEYLSLFMIISALIIISLIIYTWYFLTLVSFLYIMSIPLSAFSAKRKII